MPFPTVKPSQASRDGWMAAAPFTDAVGGVLREVASQFMDRNTCAERNTSVCESVVRAHGRLSLLLDDLSARGDLYGPLELDTRDTIILFDVLEIIVNLLALGHGDFVEYRRSF